ncbi:unnamed protein product [Gadus morhua 'NCC']
MLWTVTSRGCQKREESARRNGLRFPRSLRCPCAPSPVQQEDDSAATVDPSPSRATEKLGPEIRGFSKQPSEFSQTNFDWVVDGEKNYDARIIKMKCDQA